MKYSAARTERICLAIRELKGRVQAAKEGGISYETFNQWMKSKPEFSEAIKKAEEFAEKSGEEYAIKAIFTHMRRQWQAAAWWLERNFPDKYKERKNLNIDADGELDAKLLALLNRSEEKEK